MSEDKLHEQDDFSKILEWGEEEYSEAEKLLTEIKEKHEETLRQSDMEKRILHDLIRLEKDVDLILAKLSSSYEYHSNKSKYKKEYNPEEYNIKIFHECISIVKNVEADLARIKEEIEDLEAHEKLNLKTVNKFKTHMRYIEKVLPEIKGVFFKE